MKKDEYIGILTSGGDASGMNAAIRAVTRAAIFNGFKVKGIYRGYEGLIAGEVKELTTEDVSSIIQRGGTILKTARSETFITPEGRKKAYEIIQKENINALIIIGGEEITRFVPGELTQEVFDQAFGEGVVKTEEEFRAKIKEEIAARFVADSDYKFLIDIRKVMMEKVGKLEFSDTLLKRIMLLNNEEKGEEYVAENYDKSIEELTWHLIKEQLVEANNIKVEQEDVLKMARDTTKAQFAQYGMLSIPDDVLDNYAQEMLKKKETINNLVSRVVEVKLAAALKAQVTLENKNVSIEEFNKMFE